MGWFTKLCRRSGLAVHHVAAAVKQPARPDAEATQRHELRREVEERELNPSVTLRRTTIDEVEVRDPASLREED